MGSEDVGELLNRRGSPLWLPELALVIDTDRDGEALVTKPDANRASSLRNKSTVPHN